MLCGEIFSTTRLIFQYIQALSKSNKIIAFIASNMINLITFLDNNRKLAVYIGVNINGVYRYLDMI